MFILSAVRRGPPFFFCTFYIRWEVVGISVEAAAAFYDRLGNDLALIGKLKELGERERLLLYVKDELGYDFTREEMRKVLSERNPELSEEELQSVVGGTEYGASNGGLDGLFVANVIITAGL